MEKRRDFLKMGAATMAGLAIPKIAKGADAAKTGAQGPDLKVEVTIQRNHGHELQMNLSDAIRLFQKAVQGPQTLDIQGTSSHPHEVVIALPQAFDLLIERRLELVSQGGTHDHGVLIELVE